MASEYLLLVFVVISLLLHSRASRETGESRRYPASYLASDGCNDSSKSPLFRHTLRQIQDDVRRRAAEVAPSISRRYGTCDPGKCSDNPAFSCAEVREIDEVAQSGPYWLKLYNGSSINIHCDFDTHCSCSDSTPTNSWTRIAFHNMSDANHGCPYNLQLNEATERRMCGTRHRGCTSVFFDTLGFSYNKVCGQVIGVQFGEPNAFRPYFRNRNLMLEDPFVDGVILTYGLAPRTHIWTFVAAESESEYDDEACPCTRTDVSYEGLVPPFIGEDYFCDTGSWSRPSEVYYTDNLLWDGKGCGPTSSCCTWRDPPWFCKVLTQQTTDWLELRVCTDSSSSDEQILLELIEIYIQ